jgi:hypothetical protein
MFGDACQQELWLTESLGESKLDIKAIRFGIGSFEGCLL